MRKTFAIGFIFLCFTALASAQIPSAGNIFAGYSYYNTNLGSQRQSLNGWEGTVEGKFFLPFIGLVGDFSANYGNLKFPITCPTFPGGTCGPASVNSHLDNFLIGPRVSITVGKVRPFAEALFGASHVNTNGFGSDTSVATAIGGGLDYYVLHLLGVRFQGDYVHSNLFNAPQNNLRLSTGLVLRF